MIMKAVKPQYFKKPHKSERSELLCYKKWAFFVYAPWILCHHFLSDMAKKKSTEKSFPSVDCSFSEGKETLKDPLLSFLHQHHQQPHRSLSQILISCVSARQEAYHVQSGGA